MKKHLLIVMLLLRVSLISESWAASTTYIRQHDVLVAAIRHGSASGEIEGELAEHFTREFRSMGTLLVTAKVIQSLSRDDCKRIEMVLTKKDVETPQGQTDAILKMQLNYCLDGTPPEFYGITP